MLFVLIPLIILLIIFGDKELWISILRLVLIAAGYVLLFYITWMLFDIRIAASVLCGGMFLPAAVAQIRKLVRQIRLHRNGLRTDGFLTEKIYQPHGRVGTFRSEIRYTVNHEEYVYSLPECKDIWEVGQHFTVAYDAQKPETACIIGHETIRTVFYAVFFTLTAMTGFFGLFLMSWVFR